MDALARRAVALHGGLLDAQPLPEGIPPNVEREFVATVNFVASRALGLFTKRRKAPRLEVYLTADRSMRPATERLEADRYAIFFPIGIAARMRVLIRLLLPFTRDPGIRIVTSPLDDLGTDIWAIPPDLLPLFGDVAGDDATFWKELRRLDERTTLEPEREDEALEHLHLLHAWVLLHEMVHAWHDHVSLREHAEGGCPFVRAGKTYVPPAGFRRVLELEADLLATQAMVSLVASQWVEGPENEIEDRLRRGSTRLGFITTLYFGAAETHLKFIGAYDEADDYLHPMVRTELCHWAMADFAARMLPSLFPYLDEWIPIGWDQCVKAYDRLNMDSFRGEYGHVPEGKRAAPIESLHYGSTMAAWSVITARMEKAMGEYRASDWLRAWVSEL